MIFVVRYGIVASVFKQGPAVVIPFTIKLVLMFFALHAILASRRPGLIKNLLSLYRRQQIGERLQPLRILRIPRIDVEYTLFKQTSGPIFFNLK